MANIWDSISVDQGGGDGSIGWDADREDGEKYIDSR